jgi:hypothetical protein
MRPLRRIGHLITFLAVSVLVVMLAPAVLLFGEVLNRSYRRRLVGYPRPIGLGVYARRTRMAIVLHNPVWIALTAPGRWLIDRLRPRVGGRRGRGGNGPPGAGVREPRRPMPDLPAGAMALPEPGQFHAEPG